MGHRIPQSLRSLAVPIDSVEPHPDNARRGDIDAIAASLARHGQFRPIVVSKRTGYVLAGNHTLAAARSLDWPNIAATFLNVTPADEQRILLADNRTADLATYDEAALLALIEPHVDDLDGLGYAADVVQRMVDDALDNTTSTSGVNDPGPDAKPAKPKTKPGDVYQLGDHVLVCGDATDPAAHTHLETAAMMWTDPPYGVDHQGRIGATPKPGDSKVKRDRYAERRSQDGKKVMNDDLDASGLRALLDASGLRALLDASLDLVRLEPGAAVYVAAPPGPPLAIFMQALIDRDIMKHSLMWAKDRFSFGRSDYHYQHEAILYGWVPGAAHTWRGGRKQSTLLEYDRPSKSPDHPTVKPLELVVRCIKNSSAPGAVVLDPFCGSGTTLIACEETKRRCMAIELDPAYCDVIVRRFEEATGKKAKLRR